MTVSKKRKNTENHTAAPTINPSAGTQTENDDQQGVILNGPGSADTVQQNSGPLSPPHNPQKPLTKK
jgi:hypothetical protein